MSGRFVETLESRTYLSAGQLDPTFGDGGKVVLAPPTQFEESFESAIMQPDRKLLILAQIWRNSFEIRRYGTDFHLDPAFGTGGIVTGEYNTNQFYAGNSIGGLQLEPNGGILHMFIQGALYGPRWAISLERFTPDGKLDSSFGRGGIVTLADQRHAGLAPSAFLAISDGSILVAAVPKAPRYPHFLLERIRADGSIDESFAGLGMPRTSHLKTSQILRQSDGKILCVASDQRDGGIGPASVNASQVLIARFNPDGSVDQTFGRHGLAKAFIRPDHKIEAAVGPALLQGDGKILVSAVAYDSGALTLRFNANGTVDKTYGRQGRAVLWRSRVADDFVSVDLALQPDGKAVFTLPTLKPLRKSAVPNTIVVGRLTARGAFDTSFGGRGHADTGFPAGDYPGAVFVQKDGGILLLDQHGGLPPKGNFVIARYQGGPPPFVVRST